MQKLNKMYIKTFRNIKIMTKLTKMIQDHSLILRQTKLT